MGNGTQDYLEIIPDSDVPNKGTYRWTTNHEKGEQAALDHFVSEGAFAACCLRLNVVLQNRFFFHLAAWS